MANYSSRDRLPSYPGDGTGRAPAGTGPAPAGTPPGPNLPVPVVRAVRFMYAGALLSAASLVADLATAGGLRSAIRRASPKLTAAQVSTDAHNTIVFLVLGGVIGIGCWIWMAIANGRGRSWARITGSVFFGISTLSLLSVFAVAASTLSKGGTVLTWAVGLGAVYYLWQRQSSEFFGKTRLLN